MFVIVISPIHYIRDNIKPLAIYVWTFVSSTRPVWGWVKVVLRPNDPNIVHEVLI